MTREKAVWFLKSRPCKFGHLLGFDKLTELHNDWIRQMVCGKEDMSLAASRGTYKTTCVSIALAIIIIFHPNRRSLFIRKTDMDVKEVIKQVAKILKSPYTQKFVNDIYGINLKIITESSTEISTNLTSDIRGTSQLVGIGIGASITGKHFDYIFTDDIINIKDRISRAEREQTKLIYQELQNVKNRGGRIINTLTIWHKEDASSLMPNLVKYGCGHPQVQKIIGREELEEIKKRMSPALFACNYELKIIADENLLFGERPTGAGVEMVRDAICHLDAAYGGEDYTAFTAMAYKDGKYYIYGKCWQSHVEKCYDGIARDYSRLMLGKCYNEINADKGFLLKTLREKYKMRMIGYHEDMNKYVKISVFLKAIWNDVVFVSGTDDDYIEQIMDYSEDAEHDDCPDSAACLARLIYPRASRQHNNADVTKNIFL